MKHEWLGQSPEQRAVRCGRRQGGAGVHAGNQGRRRWSGPRDGWRAGRHQFRTRLPVRTAFSSRGRKLFPGSGLTGQLKLCLGTNLGPEPNPASFEINRRAAGRVLVLVGHR